jgi:hypothetical protein
MEREPFRCPALSLACLFSLCSCTPVHAFTGGSHVLVGAALGPTTGSIVMSFVVGVASHTLLDAMPHWEYGPLAQAVLLFGAGAVVGYEFGRTGDLRLIAGAVGGVLPDLPHLLRGLGWKVKSRFPSHTGALPHGRAKNLWQGIWFEVGLVAALVSLAS